MAERWNESAWVKSLVSTGRLALPLCVAHVMIGMGTLDALGLVENRTLALSLMAAGAFCMGAVVFSTL